MSKVEHFQHISKDTVTNTNDNNKVEMH